MPGPVLNEKELQKLALENNIAALKVQNSYNAAQLAANQRLAAENKPAPAVNKDDNALVVYPKPAPVVVAKRVDNEKADLSFAEKVNALFVKFEQGLYDVVDKLADDLDKDTFFAKNNIKPKPDVKPLPAAAVDELMEEVEKKTVASIHALPVDHYSAVSADERLELATVYQKATSGFARDFMEETAHQAPVELAAQHVVKARTERFGNLLTLVQELNQDFENIRASQPQQSESLDNLLSAFAAKKEEVLTSGIIRLFALRAKGSTKFNNINLPGYDNSIQVASAVKSLQSLGFKISPPDMPSQSGGGLSEEEMKELLKGNTAPRLG